MCFFVTIAAQYMKIELLKIAYVAKAGEWKSVVIIMEELERERNKTSLYQSMKSCNNRHYSISVQTNGMHRKYTVRLVCCCLYSSIVFIIDWNCYWKLCLAIFHRERLSFMRSRRLAVKLHFAKRMNSQ